MIIIIAIMMIMMTKPRRSACTSALQRNSPDTSLAVKSWESEGIARTNRFLKTISMFCWFCTKLLREWGNCTNKQVLILLMCCYVSLYKTKERGNCTNEQVFNFFIACKKLKKGCKLLKQACFQRHPLFVSTSPIKNHFFQERFFFDHPAGRCVRCFQ